MAIRNNLAEPEGIDTFAGPEEDFLPPEPAAPRVFDDPTMEPGNPRWNPRKYFAAQPKVTIIIMRNASDIMSDPQGEKPVSVPVSINGYRLFITKGVPTVVPQDFAEHLVGIGAAQVISGAQNALEM